MNEATPNGDAGRGLGGRVNPTALPIAVAAQMLSAAGSQRVSIEMIEADIEAGAPTNSDDTINLVHYGAWLLAQNGRSPGDGR